MLAIVNNTGLDLYSEGIVLVWQLYSLLLLVTNINEWFLIATG